MVGLRLVSVSGVSMEPTLTDGDILLVRTFGRFREGDLVIALNPVGDQVVKRVLYLDDHETFLIGDNLEESLDSRSYGEIPVKDVIGKVMYSWNPWKLRKH